MKQQSKEKNYNNLIPCLKHNEKNSFKKNIYKLLFRLTYNEKSKF
jgi:hypothetical protein